MLVCVGKSSSATGLHYVLTIHFGSARWPERYTGPDRRSTDLPRFVGMGRIGMSGPQWTTTPFFFQWASCRCLSFGRITEDMVQVAENNWMEQQQQHVSRAADAPVTACAVLSSLASVSGV